MRVILRVLAPWEPESIWVLLIELVQVRIEDAIGNVANIGAPVRPVLEDNIGQLPSLTPIVQVLSRRCPQPLRLLPSLPWPLCRCSYQYFFNKRLSFHLFP